MIIHPHIHTSHLVAHHHFSSACSNVSFAEFATSLVIAIALFLVIFWVMDRIYELFDNNSPYL